MTGIQPEKRSRRSQRPFDVDSKRSVSCWRAVKHPMLPPRTPAYSCSALINSVSLLEQTRWLRRISSPRSTKNSRGEEKTTMLQARPLRAGRRSQVERQRRKQVTRSRPLLPLLSEGIANDSLAQKRSQSRSTFEVLTRASTRSQNQHPLNLRLDRDLRSKSTYLRSTLSTTSKLRHGASS